MDKDKLPPPYYPSSKSGPAASSSSPLQIPNSDTNRFSADVSLMPDFPTRNLGGHRRAHSEIVSLPDDLSFDMVGPNSVDETEAEDDFLAMYLDMDKIGSTSDLVGGGASSSSYYGLGERGEGGESGERVTRVRHQHSQSMDGSMTMIKAEEFVGVEGGVVGSLAEAKKAMSAAKLPDLALVDPKRAKRIWANRQSAARSKERKMRYIAELERKVQTLQTEATTLSAQLSMLQRDTTGLTSENNELKLRLQNMEQQVHLQDALNDALREEVQGLKMATGQKSNGSMMNFGPSNFGGNQQQFYHNQAMHPMMAAQQLQQLQIHSQHPQHQQHQYQHQQQQQPSDLRMRGSMAPQNQRENAANSSSASINEM